MHPLCNGSDFVGLTDSWASTLNQFSSSDHQRLESILSTTDPNLMSAPEVVVTSQGGDNTNSSSLTTAGDAYSVLMNNNGSALNFSLPAAPINCSDPESILHALNNFNLSDYEDPVYFSHSYRIVGTFFQGLIFLIGVLGNILVVFVVAKTKSMHSPTNCYLVSLAIADCIVLIAAIPQEIVSYYIVGSRWIWGDVGCALLIFFQNLGINASSLSLAAFTIERYVLKKRKKSHTYAHTFKEIFLCNNIISSRLNITAFSF